MNYATWHNDWNKLVRDNVPEWLEARGIKTSSRIVEDKQELITLLGNKLAEEMIELEKEMKEANHEQMLQEAADVKEVLDSLFILLKEYNWEEIDWYDSLISAMSAAERKINSQITQQNHELIKRVKDIQQQKREEKGWFDKWIFLISTDS